MNFKKKKFKIIINILFILYLLGLTFFIMFNIFNNGNGSGNDSIWYFGGVFLFSFLLAILMNSPFIAIFIAVKAGTKHFGEDAKKQELPTDENIKYFREILKNVSPAVISYIDDYKFDYYNDIAATILSLKLKKKLSITDNEIIIMNDNTDNLTISEIFVFDTIKNGKLDEAKLISQLPAIISHEAELRGLVEKRKFMLGNLIKRVIGLSLTWIVLLLSFINLINFLSNPVNKEIVEASIIYIIPIILIITPLIFLFSYFILSYIITYIVKNLTQRFIRTKVGNELNTKIGGLKNFLDDFTSLDQKQIEHIKQWDEFLIYSVIFKQNKQIVEDVWSILKKKK
ncbi:MAG: DUF2207 domain-containing protein [Bacilli bacterium]|nr:DUF2207 domain-containing protein [Bacilli bacterium]MDD4547837.1 DUF2207 domain-containing protein [Bacilli bacterium]